MGGELVRGQGRELVRARDLFALGRSVCTRGVALRIEQDVVLGLIRRHATGDYGELCDDDKKRNQDAIRDGDRILSRYTVGEFPVYVITEWDRSVTTVLLTDEY